ncbi:fluoride efflux transporter FluC [Frondihabitans cladoniiphilus]|uniref:Fluoride-specific ion channel FluC n=1 Tax=Frondihabitans cladoniiphilus TaxID=715785 RepID=A0ABP8WCS8_9MICO
MRPAHLQPRLLLLVALGGAAGTALREGLSLAFPAPHGTFPVTVFVINLVGSFALGLLLERLARRGPDEGGRRTTRLLVGTGVIGGFTTYSALATSTAQLLTAAPLVGVAYALATVVLGFGAALGGVLLAARVRRGDAGHRS